MTTPINSNLLSPTGFSLSIEKLKETTFFAQSVQLPSLFFGSARQNTPMLDIPILGDKITFTDFSIDFLCDEDMRNYKEIFEWMTAIGHPESLDQYQSFHESEAKRLIGRYNPKNHSPMYSDGTLEILTNNSTPNSNRVYFTDLFPVALNALPFQTTVADINYLTCRVTFKYQGFSFI